MSVENLLITEVDVFDDAALAEWHELTNAAERHGLGDLATVWTLPEMAVMVREPSRVRELHTLIGRLTPNGPAVVAGGYALLLLDNLDMAGLQVHVHPDRVRRGYGSAMLRFIEEQARAHGRTLMSHQQSWTDDHGAEGEGWPGREFAIKHGYKMTLGDVQRELSLPVDEALLDELAAEAAERHEGYTLRTWIGAVPDDLALGWETLSSSLMTEAPMGEGEREPEVADVANLREREAIAVKQGRSVCCAAAITPDGEVAAYTDLGVTPHESGKSYQWGTLVRHADRGHRLGMAVKVANLRQLQEAALGADRVITWNAEVNDHMIGINERLGFVPVARAGEFQKRLER